MRRRGRQEADRLRALPATAFAALPDPERAITVLFYGLDGETPCTHREIAARPRLSASTVRGSPGPERRQAARCLGG
jgi:hypothetical protein